MKLNKIKPINEAVEEYGDKRLGSFQKDFHGEQDTTYAKAVLDMAKNKEEVDKRLEDASTTKTAKEMVKNQPKPEYGHQIKNHYTENAPKHELSESLEDDIAVGEGKEDELFVNADMYESAEDLYNSAAMDIRDYFYEHEEEITEEDIIEISKYLDEVIYAGRKLKGKDQIQESLYSDEANDPLKIDFAGRVYTNYSDDVDVFNTVSGILDGTLNYYNDNWHVSSGAKYYTDRIGIDDKGLFVWVKNKEDAAIAKKIADDFELESYFEEKPYKMRTTGNTYYKFHIYVDENSQFPERFRTTQDSEVSKNIKDAMAKSKTSGRGRGNPKFSKQD